MLPLFACQAVSIQVLTLILLSPSLITHPHSGPWSSILPPQTGTAAKHLSFQPARLKNVDASTQPSQQHSYTVALTESTSLCEPACDFLSSSLLALASWLQKIGPAEHPSPDFVLPSLPP